MILRDTVELLEPTTTIDDEGYEINAWSSNDPVVTKKCEFMTLGGKTKLLPHGISDAPIDSMIFIKNVTTLKENDHLKVTAITQGIVGVEYLIHLIKPYKTHFQVYLSKV